MIFKGNLSKIYIEANQHRIVQIIVAQTGHQHKK